MRKISFVLIITTLAGLGLFGGLSIANASTPTLSVYSISGDSVQVTVNGDSNSNIVLYYYQANYSYMQSRNIGSTNYNGYFSTIISTSSYNINPGSSVYVIVNNQQSQTVAWPYNNYYSYGGGSISLSQSSVSVGIDQSTTITITGGNTPYSMYPNSPNLYQAVIGGSTLTLTGRNVGSDSMRICSSNSTSSCSTLYITIGSNSNYYSSQVSLSQNSISLNTGSSGSVSIYGNGGYYVSSNSNSNIATANVSGSILNVYGSNYGSTNIAVCQNSGSQCAVLYVTVSYGSSTNTSSAITFSQTNPSLAVGQSASVSIYGGASSNYNLAYNSNTNVAQASLSGSTISIIGSSNGSAAMVVCSAANSCSAITVTVGSVSGAQNSWTFCANENGYCSFGGTQLVRYGANGAYYYRTMTGGVSCSNAVFGDPIFGVVKKCSYGGSQ